MKKSLFNNTFTSDDTEREGIVVSRRPTYVQVLHDGTLYTAHFSVNKSHYQIGVKVKFTTYLHEGVSCAKIAGTVKVRTDVTALLHTLYEKVEEEFIIFDLVDIVLTGSLRAFSKKHSVEYAGVIKIGNSVRYLFKKRT